MFNRIRRMPATYHSGHAAQASESAAVPLARRIRVDAIQRGAESPETQGPRRGAVFSQAARNTMAPRSWPTGARRKGRQGGTSMRLIVGIIIGCALTVGGAYVADTVSAAGAKPLMVNWDVVAKNLDSVTTLARAGWKKIAG